MFKPDHGRLFPEKCALPLKLGTPCKVDIITHTPLAQDKLDYFNTTILQGVAPLLKMDDDGVLDIGAWVNGIKGVSEKDITRLKGEDPSIFIFPDSFWDKAERHYAVPRAKIKDYFYQLQQLNLNKESVPAVEVLTASGKPTHCFIRAEPAQPGKKHYVFFEGVTWSEVLSGEFSSEEGFLERVSHQIHHGLNIREMQMKIINHYGKSSN